MTSSTPPAEATNALWRIPQWFSDLSSEAMLKLQTYHQELLKFNLKVNLISRNSEREADETHFADCLLASRLILKESPGNTIYDIGSGNGLPGLILAILSPDTTVMLVESDSRKSEFLKHMIHLLGLKNVNVMNVRLETLQAATIETAVSRGFASISKSVLAINRSFNSGGKFFHLKGSNWSTEIAELPSQLISIWTPSLVGEYSLPVSQVRRAIICTVKT